MKFLISFIVGTSVACVVAEAAPLPLSLDELATQTHTNSLQLREASLRKTIAKDSTWPRGTWGDNLWCLAALYLNEKTDQANERLLKSAQDYIAINSTNDSPSKPESTEERPWTFFSVTDYIRTLCLFHSKSPHFPGRLKPEAEAAMKEALWRWVSCECCLDNIGQGDLLVLLGTENIDLNRRSAYYLVTTLLQDDPTYRNRKLKDGHTTAEHATAYTAFFRDWPAKRASTGLWVEIGSNGYQKYSWPCLFNLCDLSPDPIIRKRFSQLLDLALIEEEQISVHGRRGGGRSRAYSGSNCFESYKNLLYARGVRLNR